MGSTVHFQRLAAGGGGGGGGEAGVKGAPWTPHVEK